MPSDGGLSKHDRAFLVGLEYLVVFFKVSRLEPSDVGPYGVYDRVDAVAVARLGAGEDELVGVVFHAGAPFDVQAISLEASPPQAQAFGNPVPGNAGEGNALRRQGGLWRMALWNIRRQIAYQQACLTEPFFAKLI